MKKYRIDIFAPDNPDALIRREYLFFTSEAEAYRYARSISNGNFVEVKKVQEVRP